MKHYGASALTISSILLVDPQSTLEGYVTVSHEVAIDDLMVWLLQRHSFW